MSDAFDFDVDRFHDGDEVLFAELLRVYSTRLRPFLRRYESSSVDANDPPAGWRG